jgi:hypothetical protein
MSKHIAVIDGSAGTKMAAVRLLSYFGSETVFQPDRFQFGVPSRRPIRSRGIAKGNGFARHETGLPT